MVNLGRYLFYITIFVCGMSSMAVELTASRLLAPLFGTSLFVWTNIIGIVLISLSIGYFLGGRFADKHPEINYFYLFSLVAGLLIGAIPFLYSLIIPVATQALSNVTYNDFLLSFIASLILFAIPTAFLGAIVPYAVRLNAKDVDKIGSKSGNIYAISTVGSIFGVYLPALFFIPSIGTRFTIICFSLTLILISLISLLLNKIRLPLIKKLIVLFILFYMFAIPFSFNESVSSFGAVVYEDESAYNYLQVSNIENSTFLLTRQQSLVWSKSISDDYFTGAYWDYHLVSTAFNNKSKNCLILGLGAGTTARGFYAAFPNISIDGIEIDPLVVDIGKKYFDLDKYNVNVIISDGRFFVKTTKKSYDIIILDTYKDAAIPYHMTTVDFFKEIKSILKPNGVLSINVLNIPGTKIVESIGNTLSQVFPTVCMTTRDHFSNYLFFAMNEDHTLDELKNQIVKKRDSLVFPDFVSNEDALTLKNVFTTGYDNLIEFSQTDCPILTDDKAPIDQIIGMYAFFPD